MIALLAPLAAADSGAWALRQVIATQVADPNPLSKDGWATVRTTGLSVVQWTRDGETVTVDERPCRIATDTVFGTTTTYPPGFLTALDPPPRALTWSGDRLSGAWTTHLGPGDADADGLPGVTVRVRQSMLGEGRVWVEQTSDVRWEGSFTGDRARGTVANLTRQTVLDADTWWLKIETRSRPHPDPAQSTFELVPFAGSCAELIAASAQVFAP